MKIIHTKREKDQPVLQCPCHSSPYPQSSASSILLPPSHCINATSLHPNLPKHLAWLQCEYSPECSFINEGVRNVSDILSSLPSGLCHFLWSWHIRDSSAWLSWKKKKAYDWRTWGQSRGVHLFGLQLIYEGTLTTQSQQDGTSKLWCLPTGNLTWLKIKSPLVKQL